MVDSGFRCHLTGFNRTTAAAPSAFVTKLRKHLKSRRVTSISQVGTDRIIDIQFSDGQYRLFLEFFAAGNIVLTDKELNVLSLLRIVTEGNEEDHLRVGSVYSLSRKQNYDGIPPVTEDRVKLSLQNGIDRESAASEVGGKNAKKKAKDALRKALSGGFPEYPSQLVEHSCTVAGFDPTLRAQQVIDDPELLGKLVAVLQEAEKTFNSLATSDNRTGYIVAKKEKSPTSMSESKDTQATETEPQERLLYDDFHPFRPQQFDNKPDVSILEFDGFNKTVDEFFSSIESQKLESRLTEREEHAKKKLDAARQDQEKRLGALRQVQELHIRKAEAIEANRERVEEATAAVNGLIAQGMDWVEIGRLIEMEQSRQNPVAQLIKLPLKLYENTVTLVLGEATYDDDADDDADITDEEVSDSDAEEERRNITKPKPPIDPRLSVDIDLALSAWSNARQYYDQKKTAAVKEQKTIESSTKALKSTEKKITADLRKGLKTEKPVLRVARKQLWFEKFIFFISSDGYLVLAGKDAQQNEMLYRRYLKKGDVYVHADLTGAATVIVKNKEGNSNDPIPPSTLSQAGSLSVTTSTAWDSKAVMAAFWVNADQVSKTAPTGEYLTTGGFTVKGKKNFLPPAQLLLGFAVAFQITDASKANHLKHRVNGAIDQPPGMVTDAPKLEDLAEDSAKETTADREPSDVSSSEDEEEDEEDGGEGREANPLQTGAGEAQTEPEEGSEEDQADDARSDHEDGPEDEVEAEDQTKEEQSPPNEDRSTEPVVGKEEDTKATVTSIEGPIEEPFETPVETSSEPPLLRPKKHISARERRLLRKGKAIDFPSNTQTSTTASDVDPEDDNNTNDEAPAQSQPPAPTSATPTSSKPIPQPRGKRGKTKKAATKYAEQDEEERALAMRLLGSTTGATEKATSAAAEKAARDAKSLADKQRRREQHERAAAAEHERQVQLAASGGDVDLASAPLTDEERAELGLLDSFVGTPLPGDGIVAAIPVCAPWMALGRYKYRVKLQPGSVKKGKAVKEILGRWITVGENKRNVDESSQDREKIWPRETELLKGWRVEEIVNVVPVGKCRVVMGGGSGGGGGSKTQKGKARGGRGSKKAK